MTRILINGRKGDRLDPSDRGLQYGDGLFETIAVQGGRPRFLEWHFERLAEGALRLGLPLPEMMLLRTEILALCAEDQGVVKLVVTRGAGARGYRPPRDAAPNRIVSAWPWPAWPPTAWSDGVRLGWCRTRLGRNPALAGIKHLNRLEQVLARAEWDDGRMDEGLMQDERNQVISGTQSNLFAKVGDKWITPSLDQCGVAGVMRRAFRHWSAEQGDPVIERALPAAELASATALALTNALIGAWPVREFVGRRLALDPSVAQFNAWLARQ
ncbi:MAG: aminodeoxychorismate lyase [Steroidobacteraceae bacterium]